MRTVVCVLFAVALCGLLASSSAELVTGKVSSEEGFAYLGKFCYDYTKMPADGDSSHDGSTMTLNIVIEASNPAHPPDDLHLYVFDDQPTSWPAVYEKDISCLAKISKSRNYTAVRWDDGRWQMEPARIHEHVRPRFWYIVVANCKGFEDLFYEVRFTNQGGPWKNEFGVNEQGLNTLYLVYFLIYSVGLVIHTYAIQKMWQTDRLHPIVKLLTAVLDFQFISVLMGVIHYSVFVSNGFGVPIAKALNELFNIAARMTFMLLLILISKGWTVSTDKLENKGSLFTIIGVFVALYALVYIWDVTGRDPASTLYVYASVPGMAIVLLDVCVAAWFMSSIHYTWSEEGDPDKKDFYKSIGIGYSAWFWALPCLVVGATWLDPWVREHTVTAISLTLSTVAYGTLAILLWPSRADKYFRISTPDIHKGADDDL